MFTVSFTVVEHTKTYFSFCLSDRCLTLMALGAQGAGGVTPKWGVFGVLVTTSTVSSLENYKVQRISYRV